MDNKTKITFLILVLFQGLHSTEEYMGKLWEVFAPAKFLTGLFSEDHQTGFLIANIGIFVIGICCWLLLYSKFESVAIKVVWVFIVIEIINGIGHPLWSLYQKNYTPGVFTTPLLLVTALILVYRLDKYKVSN